ncbi:MAG TPA: hypothetical protein VGK41_05420 [Solirubrobacterales bacterium]
MTDTAISTKMTRDELDKIATEEGIENVDLYGDKAEVVAAIEAKRNGEPVPEPPEQKKGGTTVTYKGNDSAEANRMRAVRVGSERFVIDTPVQHVSAGTVEQLKALEEDGHKFDFEG